MPEFAECWALGYALSKIGIENKVLGKHVIIGDMDYSFGLNGHIHIKQRDDNDKLFRIEHKGFGIKGDVKKYNPEKLNLGLNLIECDEKDIKNLTMKWLNKNKTIGSLILSQDQIAGIGVAWGSEILTKSGILPNIKSSSLTETEISKLCSMIIQVRDKAISDYKQFIDDKTNKIDLLNFINGWFKNLYEVRKMEVYKKSGKSVLVNGRVFWVS